ncbi:hypothetical protein ACQY0O_000674 [Thecaphora frezii]
MSSLTLQPQTVVFKTFRNTDGSTTHIPADVYLSTACGRTTGTPAPPIPVFWIHTGGLLQGTRKLIPPHLVRGLERHNFAIIAPDFRLCPQVTIDEVLDDVRDCIAFFLDADNVAAHLGPGRIETTRYVLGGSSAGGWISLLLGLGLVEQGASLRLQPTAVFSIYPITTLDRQLGAFFYQAQRPVSWSLDGKPIEAGPFEERGYLVRCLDSQRRLQPVEGGIRIQTEAPPATDMVRAQLYTYSRQEGNFASLVLADTSDSEVARFSVPHLIRQRLGEAGGDGKARGNRVSVLMVYGDADAKVPHSQSRHVIEALEAVGYGGAGTTAEDGEPEVVVSVKSGGDHMYDMDAAEEVDELWPFIQRHFG